MFWNENGWWNVMKIANEILWKWGCVIYYKCVLYIIVINDFILYARIINIADAR